MKTKWKVVIGIVLAAVAVGGTVASVRWSQSAQVTVQTAIAARSDLTSIVTASGEIKPKTYTNLGANAQGRVMELMVKEGDHVRRGEVVARIESIQANADVQAQKATIASAESDSTASEAGLKVQDDTIKTQEATIERTKSDLDLAKINFDRYDKLFKAGVVPKSDYDQRKACLRLRGGLPPGSPVAPGRAQIATGPECSPAHIRAAAYYAGASRTDAVSRHPGEA